jgi:hypothetical protein
VRKFLQIALLVAVAEAFVACSKRPLSGREDGGAGATGGGPSVGTGARTGAAGTGGSVPTEDCRDHDVDIAAATLTGALTINGVAADADPNARLLLRNGPNDLVEIPVAGASYAARVVPGSYDVFYAASGTPATAPVNQLALLRAGVAVAAGGATTLDIDVPMTAVAGTITVNGAALARGDAVSLSLRNAAGDVVPIASDSTGSYRARVIPGTFDLYFSSDVAAEGGVTPRNQRARLATGVVISGAGSVTTRLDVDVPSAPVSGAITFNGVPASAATGGNLLLRNATEAFALTAADSVAYAARVVPGTYDLYFAGTDGVFAIANQNARLASGIVVPAAGTTALDIDVPWATVEGTVHFDGSVAGESEAAHLTLRNSAGDFAAVLWDADGTYSVRLLPGRYDLFYSQGLTPGGAGPANHLARLRSDVLVGAGGVTRLDIDIPSTTVSGALNINGEPAGAGNSGIVSLRDAAGDRVDIANTASPTFSARVVPGTYDVYYTRTATPTNTMTLAPANHAARLHSDVVVAPGAPTVFDIDIPSTMVTGRITVNGVPAGPGDTGTLMLRSAAGDYAPFASTNADSYSARLIPGTYDLYFSHAGSAGDGIPMNSLVRLRCFTIP